MLWYGTSIMHGAAAARPGNETAEKRPFASSFIVLPGTTSKYDRFRLPRQARDKHRESTPNKSDPKRFLCRRYGLAAAGGAHPRNGRDQPRILRQRCGRKEGKREKKRPLLLSSCFVCPKPVLANHCLLFPSCENCKLNARPCSFCRADAALLLNLRCEKRPHKSFAMPFYA